jgi:hypothetical protein
MSIFNLVLISVVVGLTDNTQVTLNDAQFTGFIQARDDGRIVLVYRQERLHGTMPVDVIARIDFGYERGQPFPLTLTLKNGQTLQVRSEYRNFLKVRGTNDIGEIIIQHPDPISGPVELSTRAPNRANDLTIQFLREQQY